MPNFAGAERLGLGDYVLSHRASHKWIPLIWLPWISFYFAEPAMAHASRLEWVATAVSGGVFLFCFFAMFWDKPIAGMVLLHGHFAARGCLRHV